MAANFANCKKPIGYLKILQMGCAICCIILLSDNGCLGHNSCYTNIQTFGFVCTGSSLIVSFFVFFVNVYFYQEDKVPYLETLLTVFSTLLHLALAMWILTYILLHYEHPCHGVDFILWIALLLNVIFYGMDAYISFGIIREINEKKSSIYFIPLGNQDLCLPILKRKDEQLK